MKIIKVEEIYGLLRLLLSKKEPVCFTHYGEPVGVLLSVEDYRSLCSVEALATLPGELERVVQENEKVQKGYTDDFPPLSELEDIRVVW